MPVLSVTTATFQREVLESELPVLIDLWAKMDRPRAVYSDLTRVVFIGSEVPEKYSKIFNIVAAARDAAIARVKDAFAKGEPLPGYEVDRACREVIEKAGYGDFFTHRTGHNIGQEVHGGRRQEAGLVDRRDAVRRRTTGARRRMPRATPPAGSRWREPTTRWR